MGMYRVFADSDGESHIEELNLEQHPEISSPKNVAEVHIRHFAEPRLMDFHPLPDRRMIIHLSGEVEIGLSDGSKHIFRAGDIRLMEDVTGKVHSHTDLSETSDAVYIHLAD